MGFFIRQVEEFVSLKARQNEIPLPIHLSIGQELISVAVAMGLEKNDFIWGTYRSHALFIARTNDLTSFFSELLGKVNGVNQGMGGSMHLQSVRHKLLGASGIVGTHIPNSVGFAYAKKFENKKNITCCIFGDGATDAGTFYDSLNIASLFNIPILFLLEDNNLAIRTTKTNRQSNNLLLDKVKAFGIKVYDSDKSFKDNLNSIKRARKYIISNTKPAFVRMKTIRWYQHLGFDYELNEKYRDYKLEKRIILNDEINQWVNSLSKADKDNLLKKNLSIINKSWIKALNSSFPSSKAIIKNIK